MGQFSWKTSDTKRAITIWDCEDGSFPVYLVTPDNEKILERNYEAYGVFGGYDAYELLAKWNRPDLCNDDTEHNRHIGIDLDECWKWNKLHGEDYPMMKYPLKFCEDPTLNYEDLDPAEDDPNQGWGEPEDDEE